MRPADAAYPFLIVAAAVSIWSGWPDPPAIPARRDGPPAELVRVERLALDPALGLPAWRAAEVTPAAGAGVLGIGGAVTALALREVAVSLAAGVELTARRGRLDDGGLALDEGLELRIGERVALRSASARIAGGRIHFPGIAVMELPGGRREHRRDVSFAVEELLGELR